MASSLSADFAYLRALDDAYSPLISGLRWRVLNAFGATEPGQRRLAPLREHFPLALTVPWGEFNDAIVLLDRIEELPRGQRPPAAWRQANLWEYTRELMAATKEIGLSGPRAWSSASGDQRPVWIDWVGLVHAYLRHPGSDDQSRDRWLTETLDAPETSVRLPWSSAPYRGRGRPRSDDEEGLSVLAGCVGLALADQQWTAIAVVANAELHLELTGGVVKIECGRLAKRLGIFKIF